MRREDTINKISDMMKNRFPDVETYLYGSVARGEDTSESDIDLLILLPGSLADKEWKDRKYEIMDELFDLEIKEESNFSPFVIPKEEWEKHVTPFTINVAREGIRI